MFIIALFWVTAITVTGNEEPFIIGVPKELRCVVKEENIKTVEWISQLESGNVTLVAENNTNQLTLTVNASEETTEEWFSCRALTYSGYQYEKHVLIIARGMAIHCHKYFIYNT